MTTHKELYPEQYTHPLIGKTVRILSDGKSPRRTFTVERIVDTMFGQLAPKPNTREAYALNDLEIVDGT
jgi:hypothetical protein